MSTPMPQVKLELRSCSKLLAKVPTHTLPVGACWTWGCICSVLID